MCCRDRFINKIEKHLDKSIIPNHKAFARKLLRLAVFKRRNIVYNIKTPGALAFRIEDEDFKKLIPNKHHDKLEKVVEEMGLYLYRSGLILNQSTKCPMMISTTGLDFGQAYWWEQHPIWFGTILGGVISFLSGLFLAILNKYWLTKC